MTDEAARMAALREALTTLQAQSPALARQLEGVDIGALKNRADLSRIPVLRKSELAAMQRAAPPFGGLAATEPGRFKRLFASPGSLYEPQDYGADVWGAASAFAAAGLKAGEIVVNCFSHHLTPGGFIMESGAHALGCAVIPAGPGNSEQTLQAIAHFKPTAYCGPPDFLKILLDKAGEAGLDVSSIRKALVSGAALPSSLRAELQRRGVKTRQAYATAELGVIAYETDAADGAVAPGLLVSDAALVEIVTPGGGDPVAEGKVGEVVVTRLGAHYPLLRFATGDLSAFLPASPDENTPRIKGWMGRADQTAKIKGLFVHPRQVVEVGKRHPELGAVRLIVRREGEQDAMTLVAEAFGPRAGLEKEVAATLQSVTKMRGAVQFVAPGALPNDGKVIADERPTP
jgi:phenylacetate-CoA ligase